MKAHITVTDENGKMFEGEVELTPAGASKTSRKRPKENAKSPTLSKLDFTKPKRAFVKTYAKGLSGAKKFVLLVAYLAKGQVGKEVQFSEIQKHWSKMTSLLGKFNGFFTNGAKEAGWVDTTKKGVYVLCQSWKGVLEQSLWINH